MNFIDEVEQELGLSETALIERYGIEVTEPVNGEVALILQGDLYGTYDELPHDLPHLVGDIRYIIEEQIY